MSVARVVADPFQQRLEIRSRACQGVRGLLYGLGQPSSERLWFGHCLLLLAWNAPLVGLAVYAARRYCSPAATRVSKARTWRRH
jgi:hypothetical protein